MTLILTLYDILILWIVVHLILDIQIVHGMFLYLFNYKVVLPL